jgi:transcriptional regulator with XRE-family HTH domain
VPDAGKVAPVADDEPGPGTGTSLASKLDHLFRTVRSETGGEFSYRDVARAIDAMPGDTTISASYVHQLRNGVKSNPAMKHVGALAKFFGVPPAYFYDDDEARRIAAELDLLVAMRDSGVRRIAMRAADLPPEELRTVAEMIELVRRAGGLPDESAEPGA